MKKGLFLLSLIVTFFALGTVSASAVTNDTVKVGLRYGSSVMSSANLENDEGSGYEFGYFEDDRTFVSLGETDETAITMEPAGRDGIQVTITGTDRVLYESREDTLAVMPQGRDPVTWFRGNRYRGGFEYTVSGGGLQVVNVVDLEDYVKGVLPSEMPGNWELEALKAQAVCARTYACLTTKHLSAYGFDVCNSTDCQVYNGIGEATSATDRGGGEHGRGSASTMTASWPRPTTTPPTAAPPRTRRTSGAPTCPISGERKTPTRRRSPFLITGGPSPIPGRS